MASISVQLINHMGSDLTVVNAARVSFDKESEWEGGDFENPRLTERDSKLIKYLAEHKHWSPFAHAFMSFRIKAPIFVARQLVKHQVGLTWNEESRRYVDDTPEYFLPDFIRSRPDGSIKQGSGGIHPRSDYWRGRMEEHTLAGFKLYDEMIDDGVAPEQARIILGLNTMTNWIWSGSLMACARVCNQRLDSHSQEETRLVAGLINTEAQKWFPESWTALTKEIYKEE